MNFTPVQSSNIKGYFYDQMGKVLHIQFNNGGVSAYENVEPRMVANFVSAKSKRTFLNEAIHPHHTHKKLSGNTK